MTETEKTRGADKKQRKSRGPPSEETKEKLRIAALGHIVSEETRKKIGEKNTDKVRTEETKERISETARRKRIESMGFDREDEYDYYEEEY